MVDEFTHPFDDWFADSAKDLTGEYFLLKPHIMDEDELVKSANIKHKDLEDSDLEGIFMVAYKYVGNNIVGFCCLS
jgi:hypothetical protein